MRTDLTAATSGALPAMGGPRLTGDLLGAGDRVGPPDAALLRFLGAELGTGFGPVEVPPDVRG